MSVLCSSDPGMVTILLMMAPKLKSSDGNNWMLQREAINSFF